MTRQGEESKDELVKRDLGVQLIIELYDCDRSVLDDCQQVERIMLLTAESSGATIINHCFHKFTPCGVSGVVVIAESHLAIHTWPELGYCAVDLFTCGESVDTSRAIAVLKEGMKSREEKVFRLARGLKNRNLDSISI